MPSIMIPKYSMAGPFKGHRSMKSSPSDLSRSSSPVRTCPGCGDSPAAVDTSAPRSLSSSIKYRDQQNKERLLRAVKEFKKELQQICSTSHHHSLSNFPEQDTVQYGDRKPDVDKTEKLLDVHKTRSKTYSLAVIAREVMGHIEKEPCDVNVRTSANRSPAGKKPYKDPQKKTYSGDLLEKHPASFTSTNEPFKPRLLKKPSKSFLSKYRYYTAPKRTSSGQVYHQDKTKEYRSLENFSHTPQTWAEKQGNLVERTREEDLKYLSFLEDLTNDIIQRGCRSSSAMERVFQDHLRRKQPNIDELKKKILVEELREELEKSVKLDFSISYDGTQYGSGNLPPRGNLNRLLTAQ